MLRFRSMTIENFGPYKGKQVIDFMDKPGVSIFWGDNGRGKTTLLNAFRYALFGTIQRRNGFLRSLRAMENVEGRKEGVYGFSVVLRMENDGVMYELTRQFRPRKGVAVPQNDEDYEKNVFLKQNGTFLSQQERDHVLNMIMPEQVSRFFLFDGELLQEYEELLENETTTGERIKEAIEKILGVPVLTNGIVDIRDCRYGYEKQKGKAAQKDVKTQQLGLQLEKVEEELAQHIAARDKIRAQITDLIREKRRLSDLSDETEQVRTWMATKEAKEKSRNEKRAEMDQVLAQLRSLSKVAWKGMLDPTIQALAEALLAEINALEKKKQGKAVADKFIAEIRRACDDRCCPVCEQTISDALIARLRKRIEDSESEYSGLTNEERERLLSLQAQYNSVRRLRSQGRKNEYAMYESRRSSLEISISTLTQEIRELSDKIAKFGDTSEVASIARDLALVLSKIEVAKKGEKAETDAINIAQAKKDNLSTAISKQHGGADLMLASRQFELCDKIYRIFEAGIARYRERLKENVERDATELFVHLSSDKDYTGLRIHDNYGLSIVHKSGTLVPGRSSGFEHIVALSLIGALHRNAPLRGPIIMDSPFGRLDPTHKRNIVHQLPGMAEQSMLLAYTGEIDERVAREALAGNLLREYHLCRVSSMYTRIE